MVSCSLLSRSSCFACTVLPDVESDDDSTEIAHDGNVDGENVQADGCEPSGVRDDISSASAHSNDASLITDGLSNAAANTSSPLPERKKEERRKRKLEKNKDSRDSDIDTDCDSECDDRHLVKNPKRRWTDAETSMLLVAFGRHVTNKTMPSGKEIGELARKMSNSRTVAQIRTQINNYITGKNKKILFAANAV